MCLTWLGTENIKTEASRLPLIPILQAATSMLGFWTHGNTTHTCRALEQVSPSTGGFLTESHCMRLALSKSGWLLPQNALALPLGAFDLALSACVVQAFYTWVELLFKLPIFNNVLTLCVVSGAD